MPFSEAGGGEWWRPGARWGRYFWPLLAALLAMPWAVYLAGIVSMTRGLRTESALQRHRQTARLIARLLDEQCSTQIAALRVLARRYPLADQLRSRDRASAVHDFRDMVANEHDLVFVAMYRASGTLFASYPARLAGSLPGSAPTWLRHMRSQPGAGHVSRVLRLPDAARTRAVALVLALGDDHRMTGYLMAYYRLGETERSVRQAARAEDVRVDMLALDGSRVGTAAAAGAVEAPPFGPVLDLARRSGEGGFSEGGADGRLVAYALADIPRWVVVVTQPLSAAMAVTNYLVLRSLALYLPMAGLVLLAGWGLSRMYVRQEQMTRQLEEQNALLLEKDQSKSDFLANVSHDLWTPLAGLRFSISSLLDPDVPWTLQEVRTSLQTASDEVEQVISRVRNLLEMARLEAGLDSTPLQSCDLEGVARAALERVRPLLGQRQVDMVFPARPLLFECRASQFETVLVNLLENAIKYSPPDSPLLVRGEKDEGRILCIVRDRGPGVQPEHAERIFEKFYRAQPDHPHGGTGLGLAICKMIIEEHHGRIGVSTPPDGGAEFWFAIPAARRRRDTWR